MIRNTEGEYKLTMKEEIEEQVEGLKKLLSFSDSAQAKAHIRLLDFREKQGVQITFEGLEDHFRSALTHIALKYRQEGYSRGLTHQELKDE